MKAFFSRGMQNNISLLNISLLPHFLFSERPHRYPGLSVVKSPTGPPGPRRRGCGGRKQHPGRQSVCRRGNACIAGWEGSIGGFCEAKAGQKASMAEEEIGWYSCVLEATETTQEVDLPDNVPRSPSAHSLCQYCFVCMFAFCIQVVMLRRMKLSPVQRPLQLRRPLPHKEQVGCQRTSDTTKMHVNRKNIKHIRERG